MWDGGIGGGATMIVTVHAMPHFGEIHQQLTVQVVPKAKCGQGKLEPWMLGHVEL
jgi:hypothetical protein